MAIQRFDIALEAICIGETPNSNYRFGGKTPIVVFAVAVQLPNFTFQRTTNRLSRPMKKSRLSIFLFTILFIGSAAASAQVTLKWDGGGGGGPTGTLLGKWNWNDSTKMFDVDSTPPVSGFDITFSDFVFKAAPDDNEILSFVATQTGSTIYDVQSAGVKASNDTNWFLEISPSGSEFLSSGSTHGVSNVSFYGVIPEPSTYALIFGAAALGFAVYRRHKTRKAATA